MMDHLPVWVSLGIGGVICLLLGLLLYLMIRRRGWLGRSLIMVWLGRGIPVFLIYVLLKMFFIDGCRIKGESMSPTLRNGDYVLVCKFLYGPLLPRSVKEIPYIRRVFSLLPLNNSFHSKELKRLYSPFVPQREDILVITLPVYQPGYAVKRCMGLPGDSLQNIYQLSKISPVNSLIPVKGLLKRQPLDEMQQWIVNHYDNAETKFWSHSYYYVIGDNFHASTDSRQWGYIPDDHIVGKVFFRLLARDKAGKIDWRASFTPIN